MFANVKDKERMDKVEIWEVLVMLSGNEISLKEAHEQICSLSGVSVSPCDNPHCEDGIVDYCPYYKTPIYCQCCEQGER